ncbi:MAG: thiamine pyrophosphate-binding protein, partial [Gammaproteobacteria bacterium]|nr:thiamine pyrophosphate-binding protein [Gammaproteobacteria bacterium]
MNEETKILGAQIIVDEIMQRGVAQLFTYPGGTIAPIFDCAIKSGLPIITSRHEQGAGYAALAVARIERKAQVVAVTSGPGVTNIVTPVADAFFDSTPLVVLCGQVGTGDLGDTSGKRQKGFQEVNTIELLKPVSKVCLRVMRTEDLAQVMTVAFDIANSGRPGPVVIDLPMDVQRNAIEKNSCSVKDKNSASEVVELDNISLAVDWMSESKRPLIIAGQGVLQAGVHTKLRELVDKTGIPVSHSLLGIGAIPAWWDQNLGYHGHTGSQAAGKAIHEADLLLVLGSRLDVRQTGTMVKDFSPQARVIRVEIDEPEIQASRINVDLTIKSDLRTVMQLIVEKIGVSTLPDWSPWLSRIRELITSYSPAYQENRALKPQEIIEKIAYLTREQNVIVSTGVGAHQHWVARHFNFSYPDRLFLTSGGHGAMGYDLPSAIGAKIARQNAMVLCIVGD